MKKRINLKGKLNEGINVSQQYLNTYLMLKKQKIDKQTKVDQFMKQVNQLQNDINQIDSKLVQIEAKSAQEQGKQQQQQAKQQQQQQTPSPQPEQSQVASNNTATVESLYNEPIDQLWEKYINDELNEDSEINFFGDESIVDFGDDDADWDDDYTDDDDDEIEDIENKDDLDTNIDDDVFALKITDDKNKDVIVKFYKDEDKDYWKARVVDGDSEPLESMRFEPGMDKLDIIQKIKDIPGYNDIEEVDMDDYEDLIDDKEEIDKKYHNEEETDKKYHDEEETDYDDILD